MNCNMLQNFSWIVRKKIAGSSIPQTDSHFDFLEFKGIKVIINLTGIPTSDKIKDRFELHHLEIPDFGTPDFELIDKFWEIYKKAEEESKPVVVHCFAGCGRTGLVLACWALLSNMESNSDGAISSIRAMRPCSIEIREQEMFITEYESYRLKIGS